MICFGGFLIGFGIGNYWLGSLGLGECLCAGFMCMDSFTFGEGPFSANVFWLSAEAVFSFVIFALAGVFV